MINTDKELKLLNHDDLILKKARKMNKIIQKKDK